MGHVYCQLESSVAGLAKADSRVGHTGDCWGDSARPLSLSPTSLSVFLQKPRGQTLLLGQMSKQLEGLTALSRDQLMLSFLSNSPCLQGASFSDRYTGRAELKS